MNKYSINIYSMNKAHDKTQTHSVVFHTNKPLETVKKELQDTLQENYGYNNATILEELTNYLETMHIEFRKSPLGIFQGCGIANATFTLDIREGIYLEYREYLFTCHPFF
jgi:hypothetical protein